MALGFTGSYGRVAAFAREWRIEQQTTGRGIFVPLSFRAGEAFQFDWSEDYAVIGGERTKLQVAQHQAIAQSGVSGQSLPAANARDALRRFIGTGSACSAAYLGRGIYDNMKTAVDRVGRGKERQVNVRFPGDDEPLRLCARSSAIRLRVGRRDRSRRTSRMPRPRLWQQMPDFPDLAALNAWLEQHCQDLWRETPHGTLSGSIADVWGDEQPAANGIARHVLTASSSRASGSRQHA